MEQIETVPGMKFFRGEVGSYLPQIGVKLVGPLKFKQGSQPPGQVNVVEMSVGYRFLPHRIFDTEAVFRVGERPDLMESGNLLYKIPSQHVLPCPQT